MTDLESDSVFGPVLEQLKALEADQDSARMIRSALDTLVSDGVAISFDAVLAYLGRYQGLSGASMFAALIIREHYRRKAIDVLETSPAGTAH